MSNQFTGYYGNILVRLAPEGVRELLKVVDRACDTLDEELANPECWGEFGPLIADELATICVSLELLCDWIAHCEHTYSVMIHEFQLEVTPVAHFEMGLNVAGCLSMAMDVAPAGVDESLNAFLEAYLRTPIVKVA